MMWMDGQIDGVRQFFLVRQLDNSFFLVRQFFLKKITTELLLGSY